MSTATLTISPPSLHAGQREVMTSTARFKVLSCGRRWGKTRLGSLMCIDVAVRGGRAWWVAPSYKVANVGWRLITRLASQIPGAEIRRGDRTVTIGHGEVAVRSADNPDSLRGEGLDFLVIDECAFIKQAAWDEALRPALSDRKGRAMFISTPLGRNWFWRLWQTASTGDNDDYKAWRFTTYDNPYIDGAEVDAARDTLPERVFRQEYLAEFIDDTGGVFRRVREAATATAQSSAVDGHQYVAGVDVASKVDFTVVVVFDVTTGEMVAMDRFNRVDYPTLIDRLAAVYRRYRLTSMMVEANSIGQPVIDHMYQRGLRVMPFTTTNASKMAIVQNLQSGFEHGNIAILDEPVLLGELQAFEGSRLPGGGWRYAAPEGMHDDTVMALAIAYYAAAQTGDVVYF